MTEPRLVVLVGTPLAGKSTYAASHFHSHEIVSFDDICRLLSGGDTLNQEPWDLFLKVITLRCQLNCQTVVDATNLAWLERIQLTHIAHYAGIPCDAVFLPISRDEMYARNRRRGSPFPDDELQRIHGRSQRALRSIFREPFRRVELAAAELGHLVK